LAANEADLQTVELSVGFADIVAYTELSNELGAIRTGELVELFESRCHDVVASADGRLVKSIGDSVLFVNAEPGACHGDRRPGSSPWWGATRGCRMSGVGLASGWVVVMRMGDVFGPPVNLAARLTQVARRNRLIVADRHRGSSCPTSGSRCVRCRPARACGAGFGLVEPVVVRRRLSDPVCDHLL
jgi:adenylate cyclase